MNPVFKSYRARKILNVHKHVDGPWFWDKYSAHPYLGCRNGCAFCYARGSRYLGRRDPEDYDRVIQVKLNAAELLHKELSRKEYEVIACGDWQKPAEQHYKLSRRMLEVVFDLSFPLFIVERSPLVLHDLDLLTAINKKTWVGVAISISNVDPSLKKAFEPRSASVERRLYAMATLAAAGITVGTALIPVIPIVGDDEGHLEDTVRATKDHGGSFVMAGGLTMDGAQAQRTFEAFRNLDATTVPALRKHYEWQEHGKPTYGPSRAYGSRLGLLVRDLCARHGILDRMPRHIAPGPLAINKRVAELLFLKTYDLELEQAADSRIWAYRRAAWTVDTWPESIFEIYGARGEPGLRELPGIGRR